MRPVSDYENWVETERDLETVRGYYWHKKMCQQGTLIRQYTYVV